MPNSPFTQLQVTVNYPTGHIIQWSIDPMFAGAAPYDFTVYGYRDLTFTEPVFTKNVGEQLYAVDNSNLRQNLLDSFVYRIKLTTSDNKSYTSDFVCWQSRDRTSVHKYLLASEIARKELVRLRYGGLLGYLFKRKMYSAAALAEVDSVTGEPIIDSSSGSFGTGIAGGYYQPILFPYSMEEFKSSLTYQQEGRGTTHREDVRIRLPGFPYVEPHDIIVNQELKRYQVETQVTTIFPGTLIPLKQEVTMQIIPPTDSVYALEVPAFPADERIL